MTAFPARDGTVVGLVAQEVKHPLDGEQREAFIDGQKVTDLRDVDSNELIYALVNSVKTLAARVSELELARG